MNESFLHYLWQFQYFDRKELRTTAGEELVVLKPGIFNTDAGPDFSQAKINVAGIDWVGNVEIHVQASGWIDHGHHKDPAYENVVLHVVWTEDKPIIRADGSRMPTLALKGRVNEELLNEYLKLVTYPAAIPCERSFGKLDQVVKVSMVDKALMKRLEDKANQVISLLNQNKGDWEETTYQLLAANFGFKVNKEPFVQLTRALPYRIIQKHRDQLLQVEALLFGQAGYLMSRTRDEYIARLFTEYDFLSKKYSLEKTRLNPSQWKFLRMRPANFPSLRIAQLSSLIHFRKSLFSDLVALESYAELLQFFEITTSPYWHTHYRFGNKAKAPVPLFGKASADIMIINAVVPLLVAYGKSRDEWGLVDRAISILQQIPAENNKIIKLWNNLGYNGKTAFDSQGLLELYQHFCTQRLCLNCAIGATLLKPAR